MLYKDFKGEKISRLGMGNMRLPTVGERGPIDRDAARKIIERAYDAGVNYFDTAFRYHGGESESFVGEVLSQYPRESFNLASKMPGHMMNYKDGKLGFQGYLAGETIGSISEIFEQQLEKCRVDYFDFYLLHNVCDSSFDFYTNEELGVVNYLLEQKKAGRIRHLGFSSHARADTLERFLDLYPDVFEFVQIQLNYLDWRLQEAGKSYALLEKRGIPVVVMEPCRGGSLAHLDAESEAAFKTARPDDSIASWAFRFVSALEGVQVVLSGMTTLEQLEDNIKTFSQPAELTGHERALIDRVVAKMVDLVPCTGCRYCTEGCPQSLNIPKLISMYNEQKNSGGSAALSFMLAAMKPEDLPSACIACGSCQSLCPQGIEIPKVLASYAELLEKRA